MLGHRTALNRTALNRAAIAALGLLSPGLSLAQSTTQTPTLLTAMSLESRSVIAVGKTKGPAAEDYDPVRGAFGELNLDPSRWSQGQKDAINFSSGLRQEREKYESVHAKYYAQVLDVEAAGRWADGAVLVAPFVPGVGTATLVGVGVVQVGLGYREKYVQAQFDQKVGQAKAEYVAKVDNLARLVIGRATVNRQPGESQKQAIQRYFDEFMDTPVFNSMDDAGKIAVRTHMQDRLNRVIKTEKVVEVSLVELETKVGALQSDVAKTQADLTLLEADISARLEAGKKLLEAQQAGLAGLESLVKKDIEKRQADMTQLQYLSWSQLPPRKQLELLNTPGFLENMPGRAGVKKNLETAVRAQDTVRYLTAVGDVASILNDIGVPLNMASINQGVNLGVSGVSAYAAFATGDPLGGLSSLASFVGGMRGLPNAEAQRHMAIMKQLRQVLELQIKTLEKLDALSKQLSESTERILKAVNDVYEVSSLAAQGVDDSTWGQRLEACRRFYNEAGSYRRLAPSGLFKTYEERRAHFEARTGDYGQCEELFKLLGNLKTSEPGNVSHLPKSLWGYTLKAGPVTATESPWHYQRMWYEPMLALNNQAYAAELGSEACSQRLVGMLSAAPPTLREAYAMQGPCTDASLKPNAQKRPPGVYSRPLNRTLAYDGAMRNVAHPARAAEVARLMLFAQPFQELRIPGKPAKLYSDKQLALAGVGKTMREAQIGTYSNMAEVLSVVLAQQTMLSGAISARWAVDTLRRGNFGFTYAKGVGRQQPWRNAVAALADPVAAGIGPLWTYPIGQPPPLYRSSPAAQTLPSTKLFAPQEFANAKLPDNTQHQTLKGLRDSYSADYLAEISTSSDKAGFCPAKDELASNDVARQAAAIVCLMDWHPALARNVALVLFSDAVRAGGRDLALVERWMRESSLAVMSSAMPGLSLVRTGPAGTPPAWGVRLLHPDGRELFLQAPTVAEMEQAILAYPPATYPLLQMREALLDRAAALSNPGLLPTRGESGENARVLRAVWARQTSQVAAQQ